MEGTYRELIFAIWLFCAIIVELTQRIGHGRTMNKYKFSRNGVGKPCIYCCRIMVKPDSDEAYDDPGLIVSIEHKTYPKSKGGTNESFNLAHACKRCNQLRGNIAIELFEPFARTVIQRYPNAAAPILRDSLRKYIYHCAELSIKNKSGIKAATLATLIDIDREATTRDIHYKKSTLLE